MKNKKIFIVGLVLAFLAGAMVAKAQEKADVKELKISVQNIAVEKGFNSNADEISGKFSVVNNEASAQNILYAATLALQDDDQEFPIASVISGRSPIALNPGERKELSFAVPKPKNASPGIYVLQIGIYNSSGEIRAMGRAMLPKTEGDGALMVFQNYFLSVNGSDPRPDGSGFYGEDDPVGLGVEYGAVPYGLKNASAKIEVRKNNIFGEEAMDFESAPFEILPAKKSDVFVLDKKLPEGNYVAFLRLLDESKNQVSVLAEYSFAVKKGFSAMTLSNILPTVQNEQLANGRQESGEFISQIRAYKERMAERKRLLFFGGLFVGILVVVFGTVFFIRRRRMQSRMFIFLFFIGLSLFSAKSALAASGDFCIRNNPNINGKMGQIEYWDSDQKLKYYKGGEVMNLSGSACSGAIQIPDSAVPSSVFPGCNHYADFTPGAANCDIKANDFNEITLSNKQKVSIKFKAGWLKSTTSGLNELAVTQDLHTFNIQAKDAQSGQFITGAVFHLGPNPTPFTADDKAGSSDDGKLTTAAWPGYYDKISVTAPGYEPAENPGGILVNSDGGSSTLTFNMNKSQGVLEFKAGMADPKSGACTASSQGVSGVAVELKKKSDGTLVSSCTTDGSGLCYISGLDATITYVASATNSDYSTPATQDVTVDAAGTKSYLFCMKTKSGDYNWAWTPNNGQGIAPQGTIEFRGTFVNNKALSVFKGVTFHYYLYSNVYNESGALSCDSVPAAQDVSWGKTASFNCDLPYSGKSSGSTLKINYGITFDGIYYAPNSANERTLNVVNSTIISGRSKECQTKEGIESPSQSIYTQMHYNGTGGTSAPNITAAAGTGGFSYAGIPEGSYSIFFSRKGYAPSQATFNVDLKSGSVWDFFERLGDIAALNQTCMKRMDGSIIGNVIYNYSPLANSKVYFEWDDMETGKRIGGYLDTDANGYFQAIKVPVGTLKNVVATYGGYSSSPQDVTIGANSNTWVTFAISSVAGPTLSFTADKNCIETPGSNVTLTWNTQNATWCWATSDSLNTDGGWTVVADGDSNGDWKSSTNGAHSQTVKPTITIKYDITCGNSSVSAGPFSQSIQVGNCSTPSCDPTKCKAGSYFWGPCNASACGTNGSRLKYCTNECGGTMQTGNSSACVAQPCPSDKNWKEVAP